MGHHSGRLPQKLSVLEINPMGKTAALQLMGGGCSGYRKSGFTPLFRDFHGALAPKARPGSQGGEPLLRKAFCGFAVRAAKSD